MDSYFYLFLRLLSAFFYVKMQAKQLKLCYNRLRFVKETHPNTM